jgi:hypothetical protein
MCHMCAYHYDKDLAPTRSFFQALREMFQRAPRRQVEAKVIALPAEPTPAVSEQTTERAKAA